VQHVDNLPTMLEYFPEQDRPDFERIALPSKMPEVPDRFDGESLQGLVRGERRSKDEIVVESIDHRAYVAPPWKLIWYKNGREPELFHMANDPLELNDRVQEDSKVAGGLADRLDDWVDRNLGGERADPMPGAG
jgi:arylsulfatase A-like enzyme